MIRRVFWSEDALSDLDGAIDYIADRNPVAARRVLGDIKAAVNRLSKASIGQPGRVAGTLEKLVTGRPYVIAYALDRASDGQECIVLLRGIHTSRDWPAGEWVR